MRYSFLPTLCFLATAIAAQENPLQKYTGPSERGVDTSTLTGKVMCGYQGWFNAQGDGANRGWVHWTKNGRNLPGPGNINVDLWPDMSELAASERYPTAFKLADGSVAEVFSSYNKPTVLRHFQWMREYGLDGVFVQRFIGGLRNKTVAHHTDTVLSHCREGANRFGRAYAVMYDLTGLGANRIDEVIEDWRVLRAQMQITEDPAYLRHGGRPVVAVWGIGFGDKRAYTLDECRKLIEFLKKDQCTVMLGVPSFWRELKADAVKDPQLHEVMKLGDIISPWTVGRYRHLDEVKRHAEKVWKPDMAWCRDQKQDYLPVVFPGFSWHNLHAGPLDQIPRQKGAFMWAQFIAAKQAGASMIYVAMFDEVDEGTAIFKVTGNVPVGEGAKFVTLEGLAPDHYLKLTAKGARLLRGEIQE